MLINLSSNNAKLNLDFGDLILVEHKNTLRKKIFLLIMNYKDDYIYTLVDMKENRIENAYKTKDFLIDHLKHQYEILEIIPSDKLELRRSL